MIVDGGIRQNLLAKCNYRKFSLGQSEYFEYDKISSLRELSKKQGTKPSSWPDLKNIDAWMISSETATFMKVGGLGVVATELPEAFNRTFSSGGDKISVVTPLYLGDTSHKKAFLRRNVYTGCENRSVEVSKIAVINVPFVGKNNVLQKFKVKVYTADDGRANYIFLANRRFFTITTDYRNPGCQDGCYVLNKLGVNEVERFAFFSKAVYVLLKEVLCGNIPEIKSPNILIANDWHSGALSGLTKYLPTYLAARGKMDASLAQKISSLPVIHLAHHMGYQGWDFRNTTRILNSLYENAVKPILLNAKSCLNHDDRIENTLVINGTYNQACCNLHLADRLVTVSENYSQEVSKEKDFGYDFCELLNMRQKSGSFFGIVNGYDKSLIAPKACKIGKINRYFENCCFKEFDDKSVEVKKQNKKEFIKLISELARDNDYKSKKLPLLEFYKFEDISDLSEKSDHIPVFCATSRLVEQKGYDIAAQAIEYILRKGKYKEFPIFVMGGAGDPRYFEYLMNLKDRISEMNPEAGRRIFVFRGYKDEFAYAVQVASDFYMMPCRFEPCGLTQMEAMAKASLPVAMSTGGLVDTIVDGVDGFRTLVFYGKNEQVYGNAKDASKLKDNVEAYAEVLEKAILMFEKEPQKLRQMMVNAMQKDFSWDVENGSVYKYYKLFKTGKIN